jgi:hypothetical protein
MTFVPLPPFPFPRKRREEDMRREKREERREKREERREEDPTECLPPTTPRC